MRAAACRRIRLGCLPLTIPICFIWERTSSAVEFEQATQRVAEYLGLNTLLAGGGVLRCLPRVRAVPRTAQFVRLGCTRERRLRMSFAMSLRDW